MAVAVPSAVADLSDTVVVEAGRSGAHLWRDLWRYRELFYYFAWRDVTVRYRQSLLGALWAVIRPLLTMVIFTVIFGHFTRFRTPGIPAPLVVMTGITVWLFFMSAVTTASESLVNSSGMVSKVYFPRLIIPSGAVIASCVDLLITLAILAVMILGFRFPVSWRLLLAPLFTAQLVALSFGLGVWAAALNVKFRDFRQIVSFLMQFGIYVTPIWYSLGIVPERWRLLLSLNPLTGIINGLRFAMLDGREPLYWPGIASSLIVTLLIVGIGVRHFNKAERAFADVI